MATLRELREGKFLSRKELALLAQVGASTIVRMEEGKLVREDKVKSVLDALSKESGHKITIKSVEGLNIYNIMRDRKNRRKQVQ